ncbi:MAG TPA: ZIP family metal transporter [Actinomycetota bacterium]|nr:ZIP family metal transporter [Actinomycetota bacterium]
MSTWETIALGAVAGFTIFIGLPLGRLRRGGSGLRTFLSGISAGILVFLLFEVFGQAIEPIEHAVEEGAWGELAGLGLLFVAGFGVGLLSLVYFTRALSGRRRGVSLGPGAMAVAETGVTAQLDDQQREALRLGMVIAAGIGLHNFSEGLAIGQAANAGEVSLALLLVIGFALHNATEGFGIVGPLTANRVRASWGWLLLAGLIGGGPTFLGTIVGTAFTSVYVFVAFLAVAAGAILYVVGELFASGRRLSWPITLWGIFGGFVLGVITELVLEAAEHA